MGIAMNENIVGTRIRGFVSRHIRTIDLDDSGDIFAAGFVNSMFAMQLVLFIEKEFRLTIPDDELRIENFRSVDAMRRLVDRLQGTSDNLSGNATRP
jgi:methoxymalonate biosynthesis acyl carrier protein